MILKINIRRTQKNVIILFILAPSEGSSYTNAKPFYEKLQNLFDKGGDWDNANSEYEQIIKLINHEFFDDVYDNEKIQ